MVVPLIQRSLKIDLATGAFAVEDIAPESGIIGPVDFGWAAFKENPDCFTFGEGLLASSAIPGSRRLVFCAESPQWESFYISSMGGAAYTFQHLGVNYVRLDGRAPETSVLVLNNDGETISVRLEPFPEHEAAWAGYADPDGETQIGIYGLQQAIFDRWAGEYNERRVRLFVVGPAGAVTPEGAIGSNTLKKGRFLPVVDWCGRGGLGSRLLQNHNIVGCIFGGDWTNPNAITNKMTDPIFLEHYGKKGTQVDQDMTIKYRYDPKLATGGTFGSNLQTIGDKLMTFNYRSTFEPKEARLRQHRDFILGHYLRQFNEETIAHKKFEHCGEPCATACKKMQGKFKKDYEPYHALGPQVGVFDQRGAEILNDYADAMGLDAIQVGGMLAWIMECVAEGLIEPADYGLPPAADMVFSKFTADTGEFDLVEDSMKNARYAMAAIDAILFDERAAPFRKGIRLAAYDLDARHPDTLPGHRAVYLAHGEAGSMVPNQYFTPGMGSPMPLMGKYYVFYGKDLLTPAELGRKNVERMVYELMNDNCGICRFHRGWAEPLLEELINRLYDIGVDFKKHHFELANEIARRELGKGVPWETERMADMLFNYLADVEAETGTEDVPLMRWASHKDRLLAAQAFWLSILKGQEHAFALGPDFITDNPPPMGRNRPARG